MTPKGGKPCSCFRPEVQVALGKCRLTRLVAATTFLATSASAQDFAIEPPASPSQMRVLLQGDYRGLHEHEAAAVSIVPQAGAASLVVALDLLGIMSFAGSLGTLVVAEQNAHEDGGTKSVNMAVASLAAGMRTPTLRFTDKHHESAYPGAWLSVRYGRSWHNAHYALDICQDCDGWDMAHSDGSFMEGVVTMGTFGGMLGLLAELGYRRYLDPGLSRYAATLGVGVSW